MIVETKYQISSEAVSWRGKIGASVRCGLCCFTHIPRLIWRLIFAAMAALPLFLLMIKGESEPLLFEFLFFFFSPLFVPDLDVKIRL